MIEEKDFLLREIQRLTLLLKSLISKVSDFDTGNTGIGINETDAVLHSEFNVSLKNITGMFDAVFLKKFEDMNEGYIESFIELFFEVIKKINSSSENILLDRLELIKKNILMINLLDKKSKTFSMERMQMKNTLQQYL